MKKLLIGLSLLGSMSSFADGISNTDIMYSLINCKGNVIVDYNEKSENMSLQIFTSKDGKGNLILSRNVTNDGIILDGNASALLPISMSNTSEPTINLHSDRFMVNAEIIRAPKTNKAYINGKVGSANFDNMECNFHAR